jgi:hypothetical protein
MRLISIREYIKLYFVDGSIAPKTVINMITSGELPGRKMGGKWYVDLSVPSTGNDLADKVLRS